MKFCKCFKKLWYTTFGWVRPSKISYS